MTGSNHSQCLPGPTTASYSTTITNGLPCPRLTRENSIDDMPTCCSPTAYVAQSLAPILPAQDTSTDVFPVFSTGNVMQSTGAEVTKWYLYTLEKDGDKVRLRRRTAEEYQLSMDLSANYDVSEKVSVKVEDSVEDAAHETIVEVYNKIFGAFYSVPPYIIATSIKDATSQAEELAKVAKDLGCIYLNSSHISNDLLQYRQSLYKAILADPPRYLLLAICLENNFMYTESLIHLIGAYPCWPRPTSHTMLPEEIRRLIVKKSHDLSIEVLEVERELLLLTITTPSGEHYKCDASSQSDTWFIVQVFRDTLTNALRQHDASTPSLKRGSLFRKIRVGGSRYMVYEDVRRMLQRAMPSAVDTLDEDLNILKEFASEIVKDLARNELSLGVEEDKVGWLTYVKVEREDILSRASGERKV